MEERDLLPRIKDLANRCANKNIITCSPFLTPHEQAEVLEYCRRVLRVTPLFHGGYEDAERRMAFFLPDWLDEESFDPSPYMKAVEAKAPFSSLSHRDFLGSLMGLGIERECVGDIIVKEQTGWFFLLPSITPHVLSSMVKVGRDGVSVSEVDLFSLPAFEKELKEVTFTVQSLRIDAVASGIFRLSRSSCQDLFIRGDVSLNHFPCLDKDASVSEGDIISLRHYGKAKILSADGRSRKGRIFVTAGIYI